MKEKQGKAIHFFVLILPQARSLKGERLQNKDVALIRKPKGENLKNRTKQLLILLIIFSVLFLVNSLI